MDNQKAGCIGANMPAALLAWLVAAAVVSVVVLEDAVGSLVKMKTKATVVAGVVMMHI